MSEGDVARSFVTTIVTGMDCEEKNAHVRTAGVHVVIFGGWLNWNVFAGGALLVVDVPDGPNG